MKLLNVLQGWNSYTPEFTAELSLKGKEITAIKNALKEVGGNEKMTLQFEEIEKVILEEEKRIKD